MASTLRSMLPIALRERPKTGVAPASRRCWSARRSRRYRVLGRTLILILIALHGAACAPPSGGDGNLSPDDDYLPPNPAVYVIQTDGQPREIARQTLSTGGGVLSATEGFAIDVPAGALDNETTFVVTTESITSHDFPENVTAITPFYDVTGMDTMSNDFMTVSIPMEISDGEFPAVINWDPDTGRAEVLPLVSYDGAVAKVVTRHFSVYVGIKLPIDFLKNLDYATHYRAGYDDWQFGNFPSWVAMRGVCVGMTLSSLWYFETLKEENLRNLRSQYRYGRYGYNKEDTPSFTEDDDVGRRLVSMVQKDGRDEIWDWYYRLNPPMIHEEGGKRLATVDESMLLEVATALVVEQAPQYLGVSSKGWTNHHAIICSGIKGHTLYCVDPNHAGETKSLTLDTTKHEWIPYVSTVEIVQHVAKSSTATWEIMPALWEQMKSGTIGDSVFPPVGYHVSLHDPVTGNVQESRIVNLDSVNKVDTPHVSFFASTESSLDYTVFQLNEDSISELYARHDGRGNANPDDMASITLKKDELVTIGILAQSPVAGQSKAYFGYIDFKWFTVEYVGDEEAPPPVTPTAPTVTISSPSNGNTFNKGDNIQFTGSAINSAGAVLDESRLQWTSSIDGYVGHETSFTNNRLSAGQHTITLTAMDADGLEGTATVTITIIEPEETPWQALVNGSWTMEWTCAGNDYVSREALSFYADGTLSRGGMWTSQSGTWTLNGFQVTLIFSNDYATATFTGSINAELIRIEGTHSNTLGCSGPWEANRNIY